MSDLKDKITVMERAFGGEEVESKSKEVDTWLSATRGSWNWRDFDYRIREVKPKPVYYYRWKRYNKDTISVSGYTSELMGESWTKIESSKTTYEEIT